jgi:hypothetical protein
VALGWRMERDGWRMGRGGRAGGQLVTSAEVKRAQAKEPKSNA